MQIYQLATLPKYPFLPFEQNVEKIIEIIEWRKIAGTFFPEISLNMNFTRVGYKELVSQKCEPFFNSAGANLIKPYC
jgi:tRNA A37 threonylcarbamoyladenosine biosynthesis protein TsaE